MELRGAGVYLSCVCVVERKGIQVKDETKCVLKMIVSHFLAFYARPTCVIRALIPPIWGGIFIIIFLGWEGVGGNLSPR